MRLGLGGRRLPTFSLRLDPPPSPDAELRRRIQDRSRSRYAMLIGDIDEQLLQIRARQETMQPQHPPEDPLEEGAQPPSQTGGRRGNRTRGRGGRDKGQQLDTLIHTMYHPDAADPPKRAQRSAESMSGPQGSDQHAGATRNQENREGGGNA